MIIDLIAAILNFLSEFLTKKQSFYACVTSLSKFGHVAEVDMQNGVQEDRRYENNNKYHGVLLHSSSCKQSDKELQALQQIAYPENETGGAR